MPGPSTPAAARSKVLQDRLQRGGRQAAVATRTADRHHLRLRAPRRSPPDRPGRRRSRSPRRRGSRPARTSARRPVSPRDPPAITTCPELNLVDCGPRARQQAENAGSIVPAAGSLGAPAGMPIGDDPQLARVPLAGRDPVADLGRVEADRQVGLDRERPRSRRSRHRLRRRCRRRPPGAPQRLIASIAAAAGSRGSPSKPVPKIASTTAPAPSSQASRSSAPALLQLEDLDLEAQRRAGAAPRPARRRRCCPCRRRSAPGPCGASPATASASAVPAASIRSASAMPCSSIAQRSTARIPSASKSGLSHDSISGSVDDGDRGRKVARVGQRESIRRPAAAAAARPESATVGGSPATTSISTQAEAAAEAERLDHRLLGGEAGGEVPAGPGSGRGVVALGLGEDPLGEARVALQRALQAVDLEQVDPDARAIRAPTCRCPRSASPSPARRSLPAPSADVADLLQVGHGFPEVRLRARHERFGQAQRSGPVDVGADRRLAQRRDRRLVAGRAGEGRAASRR